MQLRKWADLLVIAPLDANTMAKMSTGICNNLLVILSYHFNTLHDRSPALLIVLAVQQPKVKWGRNKKDWIFTHGYNIIILVCVNRRKNITPSSPTFQALGWNAGKVDCRHYCSQLGFCVTATGDQSQPMVDVQALSRMVGIQGRNLGDP